ncbi:hypothetical protein [Amycolatopsis australiensis]|uniref:Uncharacterized protein n=1 Tax=Amycolatopsis australiensis TaxID=546364 RepID=A0A1K1RSY8_9PSEU|nr:hypothetical protein [Amycolatopsis australiensis]SFW74994.1 hypothetical protein SAMN04489730_3867 [Amycolatopsis australiensis]
MLRLPAVAAVAVAVAVLAEGCGNPSAGPLPSAVSLHQVQITVTGGPGTTYQVIKNRAAGAPIVVSDAGKDVMTLPTGDPLPALQVRVTGQLRDTFGCEINVDGRDAARKNRETNPQNASTAVAVCDLVA